MCEQKKTPHIHAEVIKAWADGAKIEAFNGKNWKVLKDPNWCNTLEYRVKPIPVPLWKIARHIASGPWEHTDKTYGWQSVVDAVIKAHEERK